MTSGLIRVERPVKDRSLPLLQQDHYLALDSSHLNLDSI